MAEVGVLSPVQAIGVCQSPSPPAAINVVALPAKVTVMSMTAGYLVPARSRGQKGGGSPSSVAGGAGPKWLGRWARLARRPWRLWWPFRWAHATRETAGRYPGW